MKIIRKAIYNGVEVQSEELVITTEILNNWLLNRIVVPQFKDNDELMRFITAINLLIEPVSGGVIGPVGFFYNQDLEPIQSLGEIAISTKDGNSYIVTLDKFNMWDEDQPEGNSSLRDYLQDERNETLQLEGYSSWSPDSKNSDGAYSYSSIAVDTFIPFISHFYLNQNNKSELEWFEISTMKRISITDDIDDYWCFIA
jgi:hypothetical protein